MGIFIYKYRVDTKLFLHARLNMDQLNITFRRHLLIGVLMKDRSIPSDIVPIVKSFVFYTPVEGRARNAKNDMLQVMRGAKRYDVTANGSSHWIFHFRHDTLQVQMIHCARCGNYDHPWRDIVNDKVKCRCLEL